MVIWEACLATGFKAPRSGTGADNPAQHHTSPALAVGALKDSISTPAVASKPGTVVKKQVRSLNEVVWSQSDDPKPLHPDQIGPGK